MIRPKIKHPSVHLPTPRHYEIRIGKNVIKVTIQNPGCGVIETDLKDLTIYDRDSENLSREQDTYNDRIDVLEGFILACACAGIDIDSPEFVDAITTTLDAIENNS